MDNLKASDIMERIILRGGLYGRAASNYIRDEKQSYQFIRECFEQCHNKSAQDLWGSELVKDIRKFITEKN
jgi:hypothetical protein